MARKRAQRFFWHVPATATDSQFCWDNWSQTAPGGGGTANIGADIVVPLVNTSQGAFLSEVPEADEFVVERIVGQYMMQAINITQNRMCIHRVYPAMSDAVAVGIRDLFSQDDAETDFLWQKVEPLSAGLDTDWLGTWQAPTTGTFPAAQDGSRLGAVDIRVGRRLRQGEALIWHTQISTVGGGDPTDATYYLRMNTRILVRQG